MIYGICIPSRKEKFKTHVESKQVEANIIDAVTNINDERIQNFPKYNEAEKNNLCTLSHLLALQKISLSNEPYGIVLEDDVYLHKNFSKMISDLLMTNFIKDVVFLGYLFHRKPLSDILDTKKIQKLDQFDISENAVHTFGTQGYIVTKEYACKVIKKGELVRFLCPEDAVISCSKLYKGITYYNYPNTRMVAFPPLVIERFDLYGSSLDHTTYNCAAFSRLDEQFLESYN